MATTAYDVSNWGIGPNTTIGSTSAKPVWQNLDEVYVDQGPAMRRRGKTRIVSFTPTAKVVDFDGVNDKIDLSADSRVLLGTRFRLKTLFVCDTIASDRVILGKQGAATVAFIIKQTTTSTVTVAARDSAGNTTTLTWTGVAAGTKCALIIDRDGASLTGWLNGTTKTGVMAVATNAMDTGQQTLGADNGAGFILGAIDHLTAYSTVGMSYADGWCRTLHPRADNVIFDYLVTLDANNYCLDRGPYEATGLGLGSPASTRAPLALNSDQVLALASCINTSGRRQQYCVVRDRVYPVTL